MNFFRYLSGIIIIIFFCPGSVLAIERKSYAASIDKDGIQRIEMVGGDYFFTPNLVVVRVNVPVEIRIVKEPGVVPHNIVMKFPEAGMDFNEEMRSKEPKVIKFTPSKTGRYLFYCDKKPPFLKSHKDKGMEGIIEVVE